MTPSPPLCLSFSLSLSLTHTHTHMHSFLCICLAWALYKMDIDTQHSILCYRTCSYHGNQSRLLHSLLAKTATIHLHWQGGKEKNSPQTMRWCSQLPSLKPTNHHWKQAFICGCLDIKSNLPPLTYRRDRDRLKVDYQNNYSLLAATAPTFPTAYTQHCHLEQTVPRNRASWQG